MRPSPFSMIAQSLALVVIGIVLSAFVLIRTFSTVICGGFLICQGSPLPPIGNTFALLEWLSHVALIFLLVFGALTLVITFLIYSRQDWDMIGALRLTSFFVIAQGIGAVGSMVIGYGFQVFHMFALGLSLAALAFLAARVFYSDNDEYRQGTYLAVLALVSLVSVIPYILQFSS